MICSKNCSCLLCRELQSCQPKSSKINMKKSDSKMGDNSNFILRKAEAFKPSGALGFIRGAARLSVRHWQNKERQAVIHGTQPPRVSRAASCEQIFPIKMNIDMSSSKMFRAPSCEQITKNRVSDSKPLFRIITESKFVGKSQNSDMYSGKDRSQSKGLLKLKKRDDATYSKTTHEKYIPLPAYEPKFNGHTYTELKPKFVDSEGKSKIPPIYQEVKRKVDKDKNGSRPASVKVGQPKKQTTDLAACFQELSKKTDVKTRSEYRPESSEHREKTLNQNKVLAESIKQNNHKVVIYFGDSMLRNQGPDVPACSSTRDLTKEDIYAKRLLEETGNLGITKSTKTNGTADLVSQISIENEPIYSEITYSDKKPGDSGAKSVMVVDEVVEGKVCQDDNNNMIATRTEDGVINVEFRDNFECARRWVDIISGGGEHDDGAPEAANESLDWSFVQGWRKR